jgi:hypothetical protein
MADAIREMTDDRDRQNPLLGRIVEVDTTYMGPPPRKKKTKFHHVYHLPGKGSGGGSQSRRPRGGCGASQGRQGRCRSLPRSFRLEGCRNHVGR